MLATRSAASIVPKLTTRLGLFILMKVHDPGDEVQSIFVTRNGLGYFNIIPSGSGSLIVEVKETIVDSKLHRISTWTCILRLDDILRKRIPCA